MITIRKKLSIKLTEYWIKTLQLVLTRFDKLKRSKVVKSRQLRWVNHTGRGCRDLARRLEQVNAYLENSLFTDNYIQLISASLAVDVDLSKNHTKTG